MVKKEGVDKKLVYSLSSRKIPSLKQFKYLRRFLQPKELLIIKIAFLVIILNLVYLGVVFIDKHIKAVPVNGGKYIEGFIGEIKRVNPIYADVDSVDKDLSSLIYSSLFLYDDKGELVKDLVVDVKNIDNKEYLIKIRDDVYWADESNITNKLTADDVVFTFNAIKNKEYDSPLNYTFQDVKIEKIDDYAVKFILNEAYVSFPELLTFGILPKDVWGKIGPKISSVSELNKKPIGSGPYKFFSLLKNKKGEIKEYHLVLNNNYYNKKGYLQEIIFKSYNDEEQLIEDLNNNEIDGFAGVSLEGLKKILGKDSLNFYTLAKPQIISIFFNSDKNKELGNKKNRKALEEAIDKDQIIDEVFSNIYRKANGPIPESSFAYNKEIKVKQYNFEEAKKILKDKNLSITLTVIDNSSNVLLAESIKRYWEKTGVEVKIKIVPINEASEIISGRDFEALIYGQTIGGDPDVMVFWHSSQNKENGFNFAGYSNTKVDKLLEEFRSINDKEERIKKYKEFQEEINQDVPVIFLYSPTYTYLQSKKVKGFNGSTIIEPSDRFSEVTNWYRKTKKTFAW